MTEQNRASHREYWMVTGGPGKLGQLRRMVEDVYRVGVGQLGIANDVMSSFYLPKVQSGNLTVTLYEHDFNDSRFAQGTRKTFSAPGLYNLADYGFDDRVSAVEIAHVHPKPNAPDVN